MAFFFESDDGMACQDAICSSRLNKSAHSLKAFPHFTLNDILTKDEKLDRFHVFWWNDRNRKLHTSFVINHSFQQLPNNKAVFTIKNDLKIFSLSPLLVLPIEKYTEANRETGRACNFAWEVAN